jgi:UDP-glucose:(heptosyl)LPS alpha-1,3-glucosyltransferase
VKRLRIALVVHDYHRRGGQARYTAELATRFRTEHEVHVLSNTFEESDPAGITWRRVPAWRRSALTTILTAIPGATTRARGYDIVHAQGLCGLRHDVVTAHFVLPAWNRARAEWTGRTLWKERVRAALISPLERRAFHRNRPSVIAISDRVRRDLAEHYGRTDDVEVIHHGIDLDRFHPRHRPLARAALRSELGLAPETPLALYVGDLEKGADAAIRAAAAAGVRLLVVTASSTRGWKEANPTVRFLPPTGAIERCFAASDVFLFPSIYDTFGMVITEAMACGTPVITTRAAGASELIRHGESGWLVDHAGDHDGLVRGLETLRSVEFRDRMGQAARAAVEPFTWDRVAAETMAVYQRRWRAKSGGDPCPANSVR